MGFLYSQLFVRLPYPTGSYTDKTIIITGGNAGLGKEAARHYVRLGAGKMILAVRNPDKGRAAKEDIEATTGCAKTVVEVWQLDMSSYASVRDFAARVADTLDRVDVFHANAGVVHVEYKRMEDNEGQITVNVVSTFLLAALVLPKLKETAVEFRTRPTLTITTSETHAWTPFDERHAPDGGIFDALDEQGRKDASTLYWPSKLLEVFGVRSVAERSPASECPVTVNMVNPGFCRSELARDVDSWAMWLMTVFLARTPEYGSRNLVHAGSAGAETHGKYVSDCGIDEPSAFVRSREGKETQDRVWDELVKKLEAIEPGVTRNF
ncbi:short-chain dehydrogenase reductase family [Colletotrichum karsti]|uniref:Short-chain dehydrogenase reductase family n=1 Tax=Colletotrichum karsti TaxID=1095194 RepID=A0A9P6I0R4_9PEZI|nr:short-chain dehydrogenase reductase family [Colletotrichum karsti]KAF9875183.1 short-chain dehydrogenase reductase family [Colletotrichum karsti]